MTAPTSVSTALVIFCLVCSFMFAPYRLLNWLREPLGISPPPTITRGIGVGTMKLNAPAITLVSIDRCIVGISLGIGAMLSPLGNVCVRMFMFAPYVVPQCYTS